MIEGKNIDKLFADKLAGRQVAYSASAWAGANQLLNQHYKWLFFRSLLWVLIPITVISGIGVGYYSGGFEVAPAQYSVRSSNNTTFNSLAYSSEFDKQEKSEVPSENLSIEGTMNSTKSKRSIGVLTNSTTISRAVNNDDASLDSDQVIVSENSPNTISIAPNSNAASTTIPNLASNAIEAKSGKGLSSNATNIPDTPEYRQVAVSKNASQPTKGMISTELAAILLKNKIDYLPISKFAFENGENGQLLNSSISEPVMEEIRKIQVFAEGGLLAARGQHDLNVNRKAPGLGLHAGILTKYNLGESVFLDFKVGVYNRGSLTETVGFAGSQMNSFIIVKPLLMNYASIYLGTGYRVGARHSFGGGFEFNPMIGVMAKKEKTIIGESETETTYVKDNTGFAGLDASVNLNYRLSVSERVDLIGELHFGLFDATDNSVVQTGDVNDNNSLVKVGLSYRLTGR